MKTNSIMLGFGVAALMLICAAIFALPMLAAAAIIVGCITPLVAPGLT